MKKASVLMVLMFVIAVHPATAAATAPVPAKVATVAEVQKMVEQIAMLQVMLSQLQAYYASLSGGYTPQGVAVSADPNQIRITIDYLAQNAVALRGTTAVPVSGTATSTILAAAAARFGMSVADAEARAVYVYKNTRTVTSRILTIQNSRSMSITEVYVHDASTTTSVPKDFFDETVLEEFSGNERTYNDQISYLVQLVKRGETPDDLVDIVAYMLDIDPEAAAATLKIDVSSYAQKDTKSSR